MSKQVNIKLDAARSFTTPEGARVGYITIDKAMATTLLEANSKNRKVSDRQVAQYSRALSADDWPFTGDAIRVGTNGLVLDGQHRLLAIEATGEPMKTLVVLNLNEVVQRYIDSGRKRTSADQLNMDGIANASQMASIARLLLSWRHWRSAKSSITPGNAEVTEFVLENIGMLEQSVKVGAAVRRALSKVSLSAVGAAYARAVEVTQDPFLVANFFTKLETGAQLDSGEPLMTLRNKFISEQSANQIVNLFLIVRAWNAHQLGQPLGKMQLPRNGISVTKFPDMAEPRTEKLPTALDEEVAEALQKLQEAENSPSAA